MARALAVALALLPALGCGPDVYETRGVVVSVLPEEYRVEIEHEAIPGLMDAMTMYFEVPSSELLARLPVGASVGFRIEHDGDRFRIVDVWPEDAPRAGP